MAVFLAPILVLTVKPGGRHLEVRTSDAPVLDEEGGHVIALPELLGGVQDAGGNLKVAALVEPVEAFEGPVEDPGALTFDEPLYLRVALLFGQLRKADDLHAPEESRVCVGDARQLVHGPAHLRPWNDRKGVAVLALHLDRLARDDGVERVGGGEVRRGLLAGHDQRLARKVRQGEAALLEIGEAQDARSMAEHGLETSEEGALAAARRPIEPDGELVAHVGGKSIAGELLQEGGRHWHGVANEVV